ncbi:MAG: M23 family metallopeptidase [Deltaproteobacteria bacterium]|nr:M23 family metallopeptidase [Deltaproteobacteria bacterium]
MIEKSWTILIASHDQKAIRKVRIKPGLIVLSAVFCSTLILLLAYLAIDSSFEAYNIFKLDRLENENEALLQKVRTVDEEIGRLSVDIKKLLEENQQYRCIAGLKFLNEDVIEAGIGGMLPAGDPYLFEINSYVAKKLQEQGDQIDALLRKTDLASQSIKDAIENLKATSDRLAHLPSIKPTKGYISSGFGRRLHPVVKKMQFHSGIDLRTSEGVPILAPADGRVVQCAKRGGFGKTITIDHGYGIQTFYAHCLEIFVSEGQSVKRGDVIAHVGHTGITTGAHLHYEVHKNGVPQNPLNYILDSYVP